MSSSFYVFEFSERSQINKYSIPINPCLLDYIHNYYERIMKNKINVNNNNDSALNFHMLPEKVKFILHICLAVNFGIIKYCFFFQLTGIVLFSPNFIFEGT
jgi:hypothetical protein